MTVYNVGLPRTATRSIVNLFKQIGFNTRHALENQDNYKFDIEHVLKNNHLFKKPNTFYSDTPVWNPMFWEILDLNKMKRAKIIHTFRDKESWINSIQNFNYFKQQNYFPQDEFWFRHFFFKLDTESLSDVYDHHLGYLNYFDNILSIDVINQDPDLIIEKICNFIGVKTEPHYKLPVIGKNLQSQL